MLIYGGFFLFAGVTDFLPRVHILIFATSGCCSRVLPKRGRSKFWVLYRPGYTFLRELVIGKGMRSEEKDTQNDGGSGMAMKSKKKKKWKKTVKIRKIRRQPFNFHRTYRHNRRLLNLFE